MKICELDNNNDRNIILQDEEILELFDVIANDKHSVRHSVANNVKNAFKKGVQNVKSSLIGEASVTDWLDKAKKGTEEFVLGKKPDAEAAADRDAMVAAWKAAGSPKDSKSIIWLLKSKFKQSDDQIARAFRVAANNDPLIKKMAADIKTSGVGQEIYDLLKDPSLYKNKAIGRDQQRRTRQLYGESVNVSEAGEGKGIPDSALRDIFTRVVSNPEESGVKLPPDMDQKQQKATGSESLIEYYGQWSQQFNKADDNKKIDLLKTMVDMLSDHHNDDDWKKIYKNVEKQIQQAGNNGNNSQVYTDAIQKIEKGEMFENKHIKNLRAIMETNMYGRRRKV